MYPWSSSGTNPPGTNFEMTTMEAERITIGGELEGQESDSSGDQGQIGNGMSGDDAE